LEQHHNLFIKPINQEEDQVHLDFLQEEVVEQVNLDLLEQEVLVVEEMQLLQVVQE
jgi:hypothetical protein